jgi:5-formyltetrahydrofolate cyclo-ligase
MTSKKQLRDAFRDLLRQDQSRDSVDAPSAALGVQITQLLERLIGAGVTNCWAAFQPTGFEPDVRSAITKLSHLEWVFPKVAGESLEFYHPGRPAVFTLSRWGIMEPDPSRSKLVPLSEVHGLLIPGVAFDTNCNRLGRGRGYYDRALAEIHSINKDIIKVGVAYDRQISEKEIPVEEFDIPMDWVVTETRSFRRGVRSPDNAPTSSVAGTASSSASGSAVNSANSSQRKTS